MMVGYVVDLDEWLTGHGSVFDWVVARLELVLVQHCVEEGSAICDLLVGADSAC